MGGVLFVTWNGGGNVNPVLAVGRQLIERGIEVRVVGSASMGGRVEAEGIAFTGRDPEREWDALASAHDVMAACAAHAPDAVIVDYMQPGALCGAEAAGVRRAALVHTLYGALLVDGTVGPMGMAASVESINGVRGELGLPAVERLGDLFAAMDRVLVTSPSALDLVPEPLPANVRYVGPAIEPAGSDAGWLPPGGDAAPLVAVSLGTTPMDEVPVIGRVLSALADEPVQVVVTVGEHLDPAAVPAPGNAVVRPYLRHAALLPHASLFVTHAGLGSVLAGLAHGVPMLCLPLGREQPDNAAAVERVGAGRTLPPTAETATVRNAALDILASEYHRRAARDMAATIADQAGAPVREIERLIDR